MFVHIRTLKVSELLRLFRLASPGNFAFWNTVIQCDPALKVNGAWVAEERYSADYVEPHLQEAQEVLLIFANESAGSTSWGVLLPTRSCKAGDRYAMEDVGMFMHWALGYSHTFSYHKERGQFHTNLVSGPPASPPDMSSLKAL